MNSSWQEAPSPTTYRPRWATTSPRSPNTTTPDRLISDHYVGKTLGEIWGYHVEGLFKTDREAAEYQARIDDKAVNNRVYQCKGPAGNYLRAGDVRFADLDGDNVISEGSGTVDDPGDKRIIGNSLPRYNYSFRVDSTGWASTYRPFSRASGAATGIRPPGRRPTTSGAPRIPRPRQVHPQGFLFGVLVRGQPQRLLPPSARLQRLCRRLAGRNERPLHPESRLPAAEKPHGRLPCRRNSRARSASTAPASISPARTSATGRR